jgi:hypothetical protein
MNISPKTGQCPTVLARQSLRSTGKDLGLLTTSIYLRKVTYHIYYGEIMKHSTLIVLVTTILFLFTVQALANEFFTVRIDQFPPTTDFQMYQGRTSQINDLWYQKSDSSVYLNAGIFPSQYYAELLLNQIREKEPQATVVPATPPESEQWLPQTRKLSLQQIGYTQPHLMQGVQPYHSMHFPWNNNMIVRGSQLYIGLRVSSSLKSDSTVTILAEGVPLTTISQQEIYDREFILVSLDALDNVDIGTTLDVEISGSFRATEDYCVDMRSKSLWLSLNNATYLQYTQKMPAVSAKHFFSGPASTFHFSSFSHNHNSIEALMRISGLIGSLSYTKHSRIQFSSYSLSGKNIFIGSFDQDIMVLGSNLFITHNGSKLLTDTLYPALIFSKLNGSPAELHAKETKNDFSFEMLGYSDRKAQGIGDLVFSTKFSALQLDGWPEKVIATIRYSHSSVFEENRSFLRIRLNGSLIESRELFGGGGERILSFPLPSRAIQPDNTLDAVFSYYINNDKCIGTYPEFEVVLQKDSFLSVGNYNPAPPINLSTYPALFRGKGAVLLSALTEEFYLPLSRLLEIQGFMQQSVPDVYLVESQQLDTGQYDYGILSLNADTAKSFNPPADLTQKLQITNPLSNKVLLDLDTEEPITVLQTFYTDDQFPLLIYQQRNLSSPPLKLLTEALSSHTRANIGVIGDNEWHTMEVGKKLRVIYPEKKNLVYYWYKYRTIAFLLAGALFLLFIFYVYNRLARER